MQTFLPFSDFRKCAEVLDTKRLGNQRTEARQVYRTIVNNGTKSPYARWANHPAVRMWEGHAQALARYGAVMCFEWRHRGYIDNLLPWFLERIYTHIHFQMPPWLGDQRIHASHRAALLYKLDFYQKYGWMETPALDYYWPIQEEYEDSNVFIMVPRYEHCHQAKVINGIQTN